MTDYFIVVFVGIFIAYVLAVIIFINFLLRRNAEIKKKFFKALIEGLKTGSINKLDDVVNVYKGVPDLSSEEPDYRYDLSSLLREFHSEVVSKNREIMGGIYENDAIMGWSQQISEFIEKMKKYRPMMNYLLLKEIF